MKNNSLVISFSKTGNFSEIDYYLKTVLRRAILETLKEEDFPYPAGVSVTLTDNAYIKKLNKKHRNKDSHTDVLSFPMYEDGDFSDVLPGERVILGDIVISLERAKEQASEIGHGFLREVAFLAVHSTLHLLGYDHERSEEDDELQCSKQKKIIEKVEI